MEGDLQEIVRQRVRSVAESLLSDSSLRDELTDAQGQRLLDWGMGVLRKTAVSTIHLSDEDAQAKLEEKLTAVRLIMQSVNQLTIQPGLLPEEDLINARLVRLGKNLQWLIGGKSDRERIRRIRRFMQQRDDIDRETAFQLLLEILHAEE